MEAMKRKNKKCFIKGVKTIALAPIRQVNKKTAWGLTDRHAPPRAHMRASNPTLWRAAINLISHISEVFYLAGSTV
ncbi:hypothetical protein HYN43_015920 [Mucilaginibacter celer]|uniref:Uncharacterized protein n=1 Tax=Mucilaginibacter celer TaxID=2305508 RepID=A0A494VPK5_9SPHI|nr:hypothetical protein HYN43_015920 [Mucilaginibacter celer]